MLKWRIASAVFVSLLGACQHEGSPRAEHASSNGGAAADAGPQELPRVMAPAVRATMSRHAQEASLLSEAVELGDHAGVVTHTTALLEEPAPARPTTNDPGALNQQVPDTFYSLNERFRANVTDLREAALAKDDDRTLTGFAQVVQTCRDCHRAFGSPGGP